MSGMKCYFYVLGTLPLLNEKLVFTAIKR